MRASEVTRAWFRPCGSLVFLRGLVSRPPCLPAGGCGEADDTVAIGKCIIIISVRTKGGANAMDSGKLKVFQEEVESIYFQYAIVCYCNVVQQKWG